jgi:hypothetical protein
MRRLAYEAADRGLLSADLPADIRRVRGVKKPGIRPGNWLMAAQGHTSGKHLFDFLFVASHFCSTQYVSGDSIYIYS